MAFLSPRSELLALAFAGAAFGLAGCSGGVATPGSSGGMAETSGGGGSGGGEPAGDVDVPCESSEDCDASEYCHFSDYGCGLGETSGTCTKLPLECGHGGEPVCACDGQIEIEHCPELRRVDISANGACTPPDGTFACGFRFCETGTEYCERIDYPSWHPGLVAFVCRQLPASCNGSDTCACLEGIDSDCPETSCEMDSAGHARVLCVD
ncbi:hypothetical protein WME89_24765 [Sorangium sp. So ce321]|uniref:hypothetical protein n=1 Tax=Sorangium sp. So ce321 TaxID=3133300 RepID=UPI003F5E0872